MVLVAYAGSVRPAAALRDSVLCLPTDIHSLFVNKPSSSSSSSSVLLGVTRRGVVLTYRLSLVIGSQSNLLLLLLLPPLIPLPDIFP